MQAKYPGRYADGLIRTVQRRIKIWRGARARELMFGPFADAEPSTRTLKRSREPPATGRYASRSRGYASQPVTSQLTFPVDRRAGYLGAF